jgi:DNA-binding NarL/FixJ family response regulator
LTDDHGIVHAGLRSLLELQGHGVDGVAADLMGALPELLHTPEDVLLLDLNLSGDSDLAPGLVSSYSFRRKQSTPTAVA